MLTQTISIEPWVFYGRVDPEDETAVYDGDTIRRITIDGGFGSVRKLDSVRLYGINAPEVRGESREAGRATRDWLRDQIAQAGFKFAFRSHKGKKGKYGRYLVEIFVDGVNLNQRMVDLGLAEINFYK